MRMVVERCVSENLEDERKQRREGTGEPNNRYATHPKALRDGITS